MRVDDGEMMTGPQSTPPEAYLAPSLEVLGTLSELTGGPDPGAGDVPNGVISF